MAGVKGVTRRDWKMVHAQKFRHDTMHDGLNRRLEYHGEAIGRFMVLQDAHKEPLSKMPTNDYELEGFKWLQDNPQYLPKTQMKRILEATGERQFGANTMWKYFRWWRNSGEVLWVVRLKGHELKTELLNRPTLPGFTLTDPVS